MIKLLPGILFLSALIFISTENALSSKKDEINSPSYIVITKISEKSEDLLSKTDLPEASLENSFNAHQSQLEELELKNQSLKSRMNILYGLSIILISFLIIYSLISKRNYRQKISGSEEKLRYQNRAFKSMMEEEEKERINIANELYIGLGKILAQTKMQMYLLEDNLRRDDKQLMEDTLELLEIAESKTQNLSRYLVPGELVHAGLIPAIEEVLRNIGLTRQLEVDFNYEDYAIQPPLETEVSLYRIIREIIGQAVKRPDVSKMIITLISNGSQISLDFYNNGKGLSLLEMQKENESAWLNLNTRINMLNGALKINSDAKKGTSIKVELIS